jgi:hypothetical protein
VKDANPDFYTLPPKDGTFSARLVIQDESPATYVIFGDDGFVLTRKELAHIMISHPSLPLRKTSSAQAQATAIPDFNVILTGFDSTVGLLAGVHADSITGVFTGGERAGDTLIIQIARDQEYSGVVDTTTEAGRALALFVPGTPFFAQVEGDRFHFGGVPAGKHPLRWISADGHVHAMQDSLGVAWTGPLRPGERLDSIRIPPAVPTLAPPTASPPGQYAFTDSVFVGLSAQPGAAIYYTLDGTTPSLASAHFTAPLLLRSSATVMAVAYLKGWNSSPISVNNYVLVPDLPVAVPSGKGFRDSVVVALSVKSAGASIYYTLDGSAPSVASGLKYSQPLVLTATTTVRAVTNVPGLGESRILEEKYILVTDSIPSPP